MKGKTVWFAGLIGLLFSLIIGLGVVGLQTSHAQSSSPKPALNQEYLAQSPPPDAPSPSPEAAPAPEAVTSPEASPAPEASPDPEASPAPEASPSPSPAASPSPEASPAAEASPSPEASPTPIPIETPPAVVIPDIEPLPISGTYSDDAEVFEIAILEEFTVSSAGSAPLFESPDGNLAYTVVVVPVDFDASPEPLPPDALVEVAQEVFERGEGFRTTGFQPGPEGGAIIDWLGRLTIGGQAQPVGGQIIARQSDNNVVLLLITATEPAAEILPAATATLAASLQLS
jgi:hypothetical protein